MSLSAGENARVMTVGATKWLIGYMPMARVAAPLSMADWIIFPSLVYMP